MTEELKQKAESNYRKHSEKLDKLWNGALYSEGALFGYNEATKELQEEKEELLKSNQYVRSQLRNKTSNYHILEHHYNLAKEIIEAICDGYESTLVSENDMCEKIKNAKTFLKECIWQKKQKQSRNM